MNTCVALVGAYLRFNGYVTVPEQPVLIGEGKPYRYHTATDVDILAVRFPNAAVVVPRARGGGSGDGRLLAQVRGPGWRSHRHDRLRRLGPRAAAVRAFRVHRHPRGGCGQAPGRLIDFALSGLPG